MDKSRTSEMSWKEPIDIYFESISSTPLLTREQEIALVEKAHNGDENARELMIKSNLRLVVKIAKGYDRMGLPLLDIISEGNIGLMKAVDRFNPEKHNNSFSTYACWWIKKYMRKALTSKARIIRLPTYIGGKMSRIYRAKAELSLTLGRIPTAKEIAKEAETTELAVKSLYTFNNCYSLEELLENGKDFGFEGEESVGRNMEISELTEKMLEMISELSEKEHKILVMRYGLDGRKEMSLAEVGVELGVSRERIRQIQVEVLEKLKKAFMPFSS